MSLFDIFSKRYYISRRYWAAVLVCLAGFSGAVPAAVGDRLAVTDRTDPTGATEILDRFMNTFIEAHAVPGAALAIVKDGRLVYAQGFGLADRDAGLPVTPRSLFRIASLSKPLTGAAVMHPDALVAYI